MCRGVSRVTVDVSRETSTAIDAVFGAQRAQAAQYVDWLADQGVLRGLIGPREVPRLWERHLLNCAVVAELIPVGATVRDIGSGAGLPGIALALARPDLQIELVEPLLRRATFLTETVTRLQLPRVTVTRARAEELTSTPPVQVVTARAVAPVLRLVEWCLPLVAPGGTLVALKGSRVHEELAAAADRLPALGARSWRVTEHGIGLVAHPTTVLTIERGADPTGTRRPDRTITRGRATAHQPATALSRKGRP
jgi:16S rRNA (guanine527-N7)-methyltransferase